MWKPPTWSRCGASRARRSGAPRHRRGRRGGRRVAALLLALLATACTQQPSDAGRRHEPSAEPSAEPLVAPVTGLRIENGPNQGIDHTDAQGTVWNYRYMTSVLSNDGATPLRLRMELSMLRERRGPLGDESYRVFLLPSELTPAEPTLWNNVTDGLGPFLDAPLDAPHLLDRLLQPGESCVTTIGALYPRTATRGTVPKALLSADEIGAQGDCDRLSSRVEPTDPASTLTLWVKLDVAAQGGAQATCLLVPCGGVSAP